jgi:DNA-binding NarL/FixJ family response regulator
MQRRILIAARAGGIGAALRRALGAAGFSVLEDYEDAGAAVAAVARERPDVCVLDTGLPGGALVAAAAIATPASPPAIVVLGDGGATEARAAELAGASAYVRRGSDDGLIDTVAALLRRRNTRGNR